MFVAVANTGAGNRVMTSPDGVTWTIRTSAADNDWRSVTYGNGVFVAVAITGTGNRVMTLSLNNKVTDDVLKTFHLNHLKSIHTHLTEAQFRANAGTVVVAYTNPERLNDNLTALSSFSNTIGNGVEVDLGGYYYVSHFRQFGDVANNEDGLYKLQYIDKSLTWTDWVVDIPTFGTSGWSAAWTPIDYPRVVSKIRWIITAVDTGSAGNSLIRELQMKGE